MYIDNDLVLSDAQAITSADAASTNYIDQGAAGDAEKALWFVVRVDTEFDSSGDASTLEIMLQCDSDSAFGSATTLYSTGALAQTVLTAGAFPVKVRVPIGAERYLRAYYNESAAFTAGKIDAFFTHDIDHLITA